MRTSPTLYRRLIPLQAASFLQNVMLWLPIEKLFMTEIGFDAAAMGLMAAAYAAVVPLLEFPSGVLADRWSRRGVLVVSSISLTLTAAIGGASTGVPLYILSALVLGVYFAMFSGTLDAVVYDTVLEETGGSDDFERHLGRIRFVGSVALVISSLAGGLLAGFTSTRTTYFATIPFAVLSVLALLAFREPRLHRSDTPTPLKEHVALTFRALTRQRALVPVIALAMLTALVANLVFEFGPLWLGALSASPALYGPLWAGLVSALGLGGLVAARLRLERRTHALSLALVMVVAGLVPVWVQSIAAVSVAQIVLAIGVVAAGIHVTRLLHDGVASSIRTGVASGVSTLTWVAFLPLALLFGIVADTHDVFAAGWLIAAIAVVAGALLVILTRRAEPDPESTSRSRTRGPAPADPRPECESPSDRHRECAAVPSP